MNIFPAVIGTYNKLLRNLPCDYHFGNVSLWTVDFTEVILVVLPENLPCCYRAREGSIRVTTTTKYLALLQDGGG